VAVEELVARRERLAAALEDQAVEADEAVLEAARRALALDAELVAALRVRLAEMGREVETTMQTRRSLRSYGAPAGGSLFVERLG
jgi:hydroxypyruvate isomerase